MIKVLLIFTVFLLALIGYWFASGRKREVLHFETIENGLMHIASQTSHQRVDFSELAALPKPVERYFRKVLVDGQPSVQTMRCWQAGVIRGSIKSSRWSEFQAQQLIVPSAPGFVWNARVDTPFGTFVQVVDSYLQGEGAGRVSLLAALTVAQDSNHPMINASALHRYLAEAVWCPTALLPSAGIVWRAIDDFTALATINDDANSVSVEFRFDDHGDIVGVFSPGRYGLFEGEYKQVAWEGRYFDYQQIEGMRVPLAGEVGWYDGDELKLVWSGRLSKIQFSFS
ncbi:DUF6544 family protein [Pleionea litopenaei]|uniref:Uncharacterized protein n=1 Tax=Pleionea litopenaei TaxID=3070815 RepID=A0AA51X874_9GAMM|nr:DUF6544 family protein [Pleionea sp. HL-JVS1]WMS88646.1 hypothetical protein Q9312_06955 [Pleionea sp. HL-JVS1]